MDYVNGVNLLPSTGEFTYDSIAYIWAEGDGAVARRDQHLRQAGRS